MSTCMGAMDRSATCQKCYSCQQGVSPSVTVDSVKAPSIDRAAACKKCYSCQQGVSPDVTVDSMKKQPPDSMQVATSRFIWYIFPTNDCNLRCEYCYAHNKPGKMTKETMHNVLRWLFNKQPHKDITIHFFGGEPTVMWDMLHDMVEIGNVMATDNGIKVTWSMTTNGTLLNKERLDWIAEKFRPQNPFLLSVDGRPATHNKHRVKADGKGSFEDIPIDLILKMFPMIEIRPTVSPDTVEDWFEDYKYLRNKGFQSIAVEPNYEVEWDETATNHFRHLLKQLGEYYILAKKSGQPIRMKWVEQIIEGLAKGQAPSGQMCGVAANCGAIDHRGFLYACQRYASYNEPDKYRIGDVESGWDEYARLEAMSLVRENVCGDPEAGYDCKTCLARRFCFKGCNALYAKFTGSRNKVYPTFCKLMLVELEEALKVLCELGMLGLKQENTPKGCNH